MLKDKKGFLLTLPSRFAKWPMQVHVWGGFGSQLFALATIFELHSRFPRKSISFIQHSSGVTKRTFSLGACPNWLEIREIDDFVHDNQEAPKLISTFSSLYLKRFLKGGARKLGLVKSCNNTDELQKIAIWTWQVRGHYSHIEFSDKALEMLYDHVSANSPEIFSYDIVLHYRLGDLVQLNSKGPVHFSSIVSVLRKVNPPPRKTVSVLTDSPDYFLNLVKGQIETIDDIDFGILEISNPYLHLASILNCKVFVGTNSKVSLMGAILRSYRRFGQTLLPSQFNTRSLRPLLLDTANNNYVTFY